MDLQLAQLMRRASASFKAKNYADARRLCESALRERPNHPDALALLAQVAWQEAEYDAAIGLLTRLVKKMPKDVNGRLLLGRCLNDQGREREGLVQFEKALKLAPNDVRPIAGIAHSLELRGDHARARRLLDPVLRAGRETPEVARVYVRLAIHEREFAEAVRVAGRFANETGVDDFHRSQFHYLMGEAMEKSRDADGAFKAYAAANAIRRAPYDVREEAQEIDRLIAAFSPAALSRLPRAKSDSSRVIFIVSRPRSGSTLVERILGAHPNVHAAGEIPILAKIALSIGFRIGSSQVYPDCVADLDDDDVNHLSGIYLESLKQLGTKRRPAKSNGQWYTDKHLYTWRHLGLIELLFPGARIIDLRRNPIDYCLSCFFSPLGERYPFSYDLTDLGRSHRQYERLMNHWHSALKIPMLRVQYEDLVADPELWSRRIVEFCGLPWNDECLRFYDDRTARRSSAAPTLSNEQVRKPIYTSSVGRAEKFAAYIEPLWRALSDETPEENIARA